MKINFLQCLVLVVTVTGLFCPVLAQTLDTTDSGAVSNNTVPDDGASLEAHSLLSNTLYVEVSGVLYTIDARTAATSVVGPIGVSNVTDLAFDGVRLCGITFSQLLLIDVKTGAGTVVGSTGFGDLNALAISSAGAIYSAGSSTGNLVRLDPHTGTGTLVGNYGSGLTSSGDLAFDSSGKLYASVKRQGYSNDWLARIDLATGAATLIGDLEYQDVFGLSFKDFHLYGVTASGDLIGIDVDTGAGKLIGSAGLTFWGLTTSPGLQTRMPVTYESDNFGWKFMSYADYQNKNGQTYYVYHPAADLNVLGDGTGKIPVRAAADGEIAANSKTWGGIVIRHGLGQRIYYSEYGHLRHLSDESKLQVGMTVKRGDQIGFVGNVGTVPYHLHFEIRSPFHPNPAKADYWDNTLTIPPDKLSRKNVFIGYESPLAFVDAYSNANATVIVVDDSVTYPGIENDITGGAVKIDIDHDGAKEIVKRRFFRAAGLQEWHPAFKGQNIAYEGNYHYALSKTDTAIASGRWYFDVPLAGKYQVLASIPSGSQTRQAKYTIYHNSQVSYATIDQFAVSGESDISKRWVPLGTFVFQVGSNSFVDLSNKTGETNLKVGYDAIKLIKK